MRLNKFIAQATGIARRKADIAITSGRVRVNDLAATLGQSVSPGDIVSLDDIIISTNPKLVVLFHKPVGYVCSRNGQGSKTIYDIIPDKYHHLKPVGRLDKASSGLLLLTNDGDLANQLTHPSNHKIKHYEVSLDKPLQPLHHQMIADYGISLEDGISKLIVTKLIEDSSLHWTVKMSEGRNRQIRRTFQAVGYEVVKLHRTHFGGYSIGELKVGKTRSVKT